MNTSTVYLRVYESVYNIHRELLQDDFSSNQFDHVEVIQGCVHSIQKRIHWVLSCFYKYMVMDHNHVWLKWKEKGTVGRHARCKQQQNNSAVIVLFSTCRASQSTECHLFTTQQQWPSLLCKPATFLLWKTSNESQ